MQTLYLDNNATTRPAPEVAAAMDHAQRDLWANPSSIHRPGQAARQAIELARKHLALLVGARPRQVTLTGSGTEAIDLAIRGGLRALAQPPSPGAATGPRPAAAPAPPLLLVTTRAEHSAVRELAADLERYGLDGRTVRVVWAAMTPDGRVDPASIEHALRAHADEFGTAGAVKMVSVQWANNETGAIQPVIEIARVCRDNGAIFHCDATQWVGKQRRVAPGPDGSSPPAEASVCDMLTFSAHKFHGPKGVGVLCLRPPVRVAPIIPGEQELGRRGGTENTPAIVGAGVAARLADAWLNEPAHVSAGRALRDRFEERVVAGARRAGVDASVNGPLGVDGRAEPLRLWNTSSIAFARLEAEALLLLLSERGVCCSAGAACSSGSLEPSSVLLATGIPPEKAHGSLRFSLSRETTEQEADHAAEIVVQGVARLSRSMPAG